MFPVTVNNYYKIKNIQKLRITLLDEIEKLIFTANDNADKNLIQQMFSGLINSLSILIILVIFVCIFKFF